MIYICHKLSVFCVSEIRSKKYDIFQFKPRIELTLPPTTLQLASGHKHAHTHTRKQRQSNTNTQTIITNKHEAIIKSLAPASAIHRHHVSASVSVDSGSRQCRCSWVRISDTVRVLNYPKPKLRNSETQYRPKPRCTPSATRPDFERALLWLSLLLMCLSDLPFISFVS